MPLPANELFESFISKTKIVKTKLDGNCVDFNIGRAMVSEAPILYLSYPQMDLTLGSVLKRITAELRAIGSAADSEIALALLGIIVETKDPAITAIDHANQCFAAMHLAKLRQIVVIKNRKLPGYQIQVDEYWLRAFDPTNLLYWANKCRCGYPIELSQLKDCFSFEQNPIETKLIIWDQLPGLQRLMKKWGELSNSSIIDIYYQAVAKHFFQQIPDKLKERLLVLEAGALVHFDTDSLLNPIFAVQIDLFYWKGDAGQRGWALMNEVKISHMNFCPPNLFLSCKEWLQSELGFHALSTDKPFDTAITSYCRFLQRAHAHRLNDNCDESFLHFVIALDLLLGLEGRSSESVCLRASLLVHQQLDRTCEEQNSLLRKIYNVRSKYVHEGRPVTQEDLEGVEKICTEVLWNLLATSAKGDFNNINDWLKQIDYLTSAINAGKPLSDGEFLSIGIPPIGQKRTPPNRIQGLR